MIGKTIKYLRIAKGLKQTDLAIKLKVSPNYISLIENNKREPSLSFINSLSKELDIPVGLLFLDIDLSKKNISMEEKNLLYKMRDLMVQMEMMKLQDR